MDHDIPLKDPNEFFNKNIFIDPNYKLCLAIKKTESSIERSLTTMLLKYLMPNKQLDTNKVAANQKQLNANKCYSLQYIKPFDGSLGVYPHQKFHIELLHNLELLHHQANKIWTNIQKELHHMFYLKSWSMWCLWMGIPCFIVAKKYGQIRQIVWSLLSWQMHQMQLISAAYYPWYYVTNLRIWVFYKLDLSFPAM